MVARRLIKKEILVFMNAVSAENPNGLSGGDRILIELFKRWRQYFNNIKILTCSVGEKAVRRYIKIPGNISFHLIKVKKKLYRNLLFLYLKKTIQGLIVVNRLKDQAYDYVYSSSDFWPDSLPALYAKLKKPHIIWIAGFYLSAPAPWQKDSPYKTNLSRWIRGLLFWLTQLPIYWLVKRHADFVFVTSEPDAQKFVTQKRGREKIIVIQGGVDITEAKKYFAGGKVIPVEKRRYDACFVGRFHFQKGVLELINIWKKVCQSKRGARLAMIGVGPLETEVREKIKKFGLNENIDLLGFKDGPEKYKIFKQARIVLHPATYDSGGMAAAEGMAWGLPAVGFDLEALKTYYPQGMIKTPQGNLEIFADNILKLLKDKNYYQQISREAVSLTQEIWDWDIRASKIYQKVF